MFVALFSFFRCRSSARPWFLIRELGKCCWLSCPPVVLRPACAPSCFVCSFRFRGVAACCFCFFLPCLRCSVELFVCSGGCAWGVLFSVVSAYALNACVLTGGPCSTLSCKHSPLPQGRVSLSFLCCSGFLLCGAHRARWTYAHVSIAAAPSYPKSV